MTSFVYIVSTGEADWWREQLEKFGALTGPDKKMFPQEIGVLEGIRVVEQPFQAATTTDDKRPARMAPPAYLRLSGHYGGGRK